MKKKQKTQYLQGIADMIQGLESSPFLLAGIEALHDHCVGLNAFGCSISRPDMSLSLIHISETRAKFHAASFLHGFRGYLETDGYQGYNNLPEHCYPHMVRRTRATNLYQDGTCLLYTSL